MKKLMMSLIAGWAVLTLFAQVRHSEPQIPVRPTLEEEGSFSMILIPDPQSQIKFAANQPLFELMTAWVAQNIDRLRIRAALFTGDMVEQNDQLTTTATRRRGSNGVPFHGPWNGWTAGFPISFVKGITTWATLRRKIAFR